MNHENVIGLLDLFRTTTPGSDTPGAPCCAADDGACARYPPGSPSCCSCPPPTSPTPDVYIASELMGSDLHTIIGFGLGGDCRHVETAAQHHSPPALSATPPRQIPNSTQVGGFMGWVWGGREGGRGEVEALKARPPRCTCML